MLPQADSGVDTDSPQPGPAPRGLRGRIRALPVAGFVVGAVGAVSVVVVLAVVASVWLFPAGSVTSLLSFGSRQSMDVEARTASAAGIPGSSRLVLGTDYGYFSTVADAPVAWSCDRVVTVRLAGAYPSAAPWALRKAVGTLARESGLLLVIGGDASVVVPGARPVEGEILVAYTDADAVHSISDSPQAAGVTSVQWNSRTGEILNALVLIDGTRRAVAPHSGKGFTMLVHELGHSVGLGHSMEGSAEVMDPVTSHGDRGILGHGDRFALASVGCT